MVKSEDLAPLLKVLSDLGAWFKAAKVPGTVIGGVAASILGRPRLTQDVDALVLLPERRWTGFLRAGENHGFIPRRADVLAFARETRVLLLRHQHGGIDVDIVLGSLPFERQAVAQATWVDLGGVEIPLPRPEDLIIMKSVAHRPRDLEDIAAILAAHPKLNLKRVRRWVGEFAAALNMPDLLADLEALIKRRPLRQK
jgi:hypothetical protein